MWDLGFGAGIAGGSNSRAPCGLDLRIFSDRDSDESIFRSQVYRTADV